MNQVSKAPIWRMATASVFVIDRILTYLVLPVPCISAHRATQSPHPSLSSARLIASLHFIFTHRMSSRRVSCQFFRGLPHLRFPSGLLSMACTARLSPFILTTCPIQHTLLLLMMFPISSCPIFSHISLFVILSLQEICNIS